MLYWLDLFGTAVFAVSGVLAAREKQLDWYGGLVLAMVTAIGGGTFRDLVLGRTPVFWVQDHLYLLVALAAAVATFPVISRLRVNRWLLWSDAFGLGLFTLIGCNIALNTGTSPLVAVVMGVATGTFGGMIRDLLCGRIPLVLKQEIYATASVLGGVTYWLLTENLDYPRLASGAAVAVVTLLRIMAIEKGWRLPRLN
ncbi:MAG: trimeric intracellular cation channel family protein [Ketobacteraceae bacterium]|nr:trimeric intracellular cation channel family protein [Ketobacteraceae bacterium]